MIIQLVTNRSFDRKSDIRALELKLLQLVGNFSSPSLHTVVSGYDSDSSYVIDVALLDEARHDDQRSDLLRRIVNILGAELVRSVSAEQQVRVRVVLMYQTSEDTWTKD